MHAELLDPVEDGPEAAPREVRELGDVDLVRVRVRVRVKG